MIFYFISYTEANFKMDSRYRHYSKNIPDYLVDRPRELVKHCLKKIMLAHSCDKSGISLIDHGKFLVNTFSGDKREYYTVNFGDETAMPNCTCPSWNESYFPCKHFFAIFQKYPTWQWNSLSPLYRNSPFLNLDRENDETTREDGEKCDNVTVDLADNNSVDDQLSEPLSAQDQLQEPSTVFPSCSKELGKSRKRSHISTAADCREMLNVIKNFTFEIGESSEVMLDVHSQLHNIVELLSNAAEKECGIPIRSVSKVVNFVKRSKTLDLRKRPKRKVFSKRCGQFKDRMVAAANIKVTENKSENESKVTEEIVLDPIKW